MPRDARGVDRCARGHREAAPAVVALLMAARIRHLRVLVDTEELPFPKGVVVDVVGNLSTDPVVLFGMHWTGVAVDFRLSQKDYRRLRGYVFRPEAIVEAQGVAG